MIIGHQQQREFLKRAIKNKRIPQGFIFSGMEALGKKTIALWFQQEINKDAHSILIEPEKGIISIDKIRELKKSLSLKYDFTFIIIDDAHKMNVMAQNCFLKTLEEPKENVVFVLVTSSLDTLLKTIHSRCEILKFYPVSKEQMPAHLDEKAIELSFNSPGKAISFTEDKDLLKEKIKMRETVKSLLEKGIAERFIFSEKYFKDSPEVVVLLDEMIFSLREKLLKSLNKEFVKKIKQVEDLKLLFLTSNINQRLGFENLMLKI